MEVVIKSPSLALGQFSKLNSSINKEVRDIQKNNPNASLNNVRFKGG